MHAVLVAAVADPSRTSASPLRLLYCVMSNGTELLEALISSTCCKDRDKQFQQREISFKGEATTCKKKAVQAL